MDDGTEPFGELQAGSPPTINGNFVNSAFGPFIRADWNTPEWRAEMEAKYPTSLD